MLLSYFTRNNIKPDALPAAIAEPAVIVERPIELAEPEIYVLLRF